MGRRIATEFETIRLALGGKDAEELLRRLREAGIPLYEHVLKNGDLEVGYSALHNAFYLRLIQERSFAPDDREGRPEAPVRATVRYRAIGAGQFTDGRLAEVMRRLVAEFRGEALMKRVYRGFSVFYHYENGQVVRIVERTPAGERIIFERMPHRPAIADGGPEEASRAAELVLLRAEVDRWLDRRNAARPEEIPAIDARLRELARRLIALEG
ncbi:MAG: hypothetical protein IMX05_07690 [Hydrogenibacillus schlegelii]|nr:hypothetical protein [Hydrogenibacillus schlegelii]